MSNSPKQEKNEGPSAPVRRGQGFWTVGLILLAVFLMLFFVPGMTSSRIDYSFFLEQLDNQNIQRLTIYDSYIQGSFVFPPPTPATYDYYGKLKKLLYESGYTVAARPLPEGAPIGASPQGTKSSAQ